MEEIVRESPPSLLWCTQPAWLCPSPGDHYQTRLKLIHKVVEGLGFWQLQHRSSFEMEGNVRVGEGGKGLKILVVITELISWGIVLRWGGVNRVQSEVTGKIFHHSVFHRDVSLLVQEGDRGSHVNDKSRFPSFSLF